MTSCRRVSEGVMFWGRKVVSLLILLRTVQGFSITNRDRLLRIKEELPVGTVIFKAQTDQPADSFDLADPTAGYFSINATTGEVFIQKVIDKEMLSANTLTATVKARKGVSTATASLTFIVEDINDVVPSFPERLYNISISEKTSVNNVILTVKAEDRDTGHNGQTYVTYTITSGNEDGSFSITIYGGQVLVSRDLDYETKTQYTLNITARDQPGLSNWTIIDITVLDANDLPAKFTAFSYSAEISEGASMGTIILQVLAFDLDKSINDTVTYGIDQAANPSRLFIINNMTGMISLNGSLDRESVADYTIRVLAFSSYPVADHATVNIKVIDVNDNRPVFAKPEYQGSVQENLAVGTVVSRVEATDKDQGISAELRFHLKSGIDSNRFSINHQTGVISTATELNREEKDLYNLTVVVEDMNGNSTIGRVLNNTVSIYIYVQDSNDNAPIFRFKSYNITVNESIAVGAPVIQVEAKDPDVDQDIVHSIIGGNDLSRFLIDRRSGIIYVRSAIDRDPPRNETLFTLKVMATDNKNPLLNSTATVSVLVDDVNDNQPQCSQDEYSASVQENAKFGVTVMSLECSDVDTMKNGRLTYQLVSGADKRFAINSSSGAVYGIDTLDYDNGNKLYKLMLLVTDQGQPALSREVSLTIDVNNINDNYPVFKMSHYDFSILEGDYSSLVNLVGKVEAADGDMDANNCPCGQIRYNILNSTGVFSVDPVTGVLSTSSVFDRETISSYTVTVIATDLDPWRSLTNITTVTIHIVDQNDNSPIFNQVNYAANVAEDKTFGYQVIKVESSDKDIGDNANITYNIVSGNTGGAFSIDKTSGQITLAATLDYETIKRYELTVAAVDAGISPRQTTISVFIDVTDANDNKPVCLTTVLTAKIQENLPAGQIVTKVSVVDKDEDIHQKISYHLVSNSFAVNHMTGDVNTTRSLDREKQSEYNLTVIAYNYNDSSMIVNCSVRVVVEDDNDNTPVFNTSRLSVYASESSDVGTMLLRLTASDEDEGHNSEIRYALMGDGTKFAINETTGIVTLVSSLDREATSYYTLRIVARDLGLPQPRSSMVQVMVNVTDVNDNSPVFAQTVYLSSVPENANGTLVMMVSAQDSDEGSNGYVQYSITGGNIGNAFSINSSGAVMTVTPLDRETIDQYELTIIARDGGVPSLEKSIKAVISVLDVNDNRPNITNTPVQLTVQENTPTGSLVYLLTADDKDLGLTTRVTYTGYAEPSGTFAIIPSTGMITSIGVLDRETTQRYKFHAFATDHGSPPLNSSVVSFDIVVSDVNDNNPVFNPVLYTVNISEDVAIGTAIVRVNASDTDLGGAGRIVFKIEVGDTKEHFSIDNTTGVIMNSKTLDRESIARFDLVISAKDHGSPERYGYGYVTIYIEDRNDLAPLFLLNQYFSSIKESIGIGTSVGTVIASDGDVGYNSKISYSLVSGEGMADFNITTHEVSSSDSQIKRFIGRIYSARHLDRESHAIYNLTVLATDGVHNSTMQVILTLEDVNDNSPIFDVNTTVINISLAENTQGGTAVMNVIAHDVDEGSNARISYSLTGGDGKFYMDSDTGVLFTTPQILDREMKDFYVLEILASDPGNNKANVTVNVQVLDVNDSPPQFNSSVVAINVDEGIGDVVIDVRATDKDQGTNQEIEYRIVSGNENDIFQINNKTGNLTSAKILDREKPGLKLDRNGNGVYSLVVEAADHGIPQLSSKMNVIITVHDINDNAPVFQQSLYSYEIPENASIGEVLGNIKAEEKDLGVNGQVVYSALMSGNVIPFAVSSSTGILQVNNSLDRESTSSYEFKVSASDKGNPSLNNTATIKILIQDINDNTPIFGQAEYHVTIPENTPGGSSIIILDARDSDEGSNGKIGYAIIDGSQGHFIIEELTGIIRTFGYLDYEINQSYTINVSAYDHGTPSLRSSVLVFISITDINDHVPAFDHLQYSVNISEDSPVNTSVLVVQATDLDQGPNAQVSYSLVDDFGVFDVSLDSGELSTKKQLDREEKSFYQLQVKAIDHGDNRLSSIALVKVTVTDINDNTPSFIKPSFNFQTSEDAFNGAILGSVKAVDRDIGDNAKLNYTIDNRKDLFEINIHTGSLSLVQSAIGLANHNISLLVTCSDNGRPSLSSVASVNVFISVGSRKVPKLVPRHLNVSVYENATLGETIVKLNASVRDNSKIEYSLLAGDHGKFYLNSTNGILYLIGSLDRENKASYTLFFVVKDRTWPLYSDYGSIVITILDINDNQPTFTQRPVVLPVPENTAIGTMVAHVTARDLDEGVNGEVFYFLQGDGSSTFDIDNRTGDVRTKTALDYETTRYYNITVTAENTMSSLRKRSHLTLTVNVEDVPDYKPTFSRDWLTTSIKEDAPIGSFLIDVNATLHDEKSSYIFYRVIHNQSSSNSYHFAVEPESGIIRSQAQLDRESTSNYTLVVEARDLRGTNEFRAIAHLIIDILDVNDNNPFFPQKSYTLFPKETSSLGEVIGQFQARDLDGGENAQVFYEISDGNQNGCFGINTSDGRLFITKSLDFETHSTYLLKVRAYDKQRASLTRAKRDASSPDYDEAVVTVQVQDENDNPPVFTQQVYFGNFYPETSESSVLVTVKAIDSDSGRNDILRYYSTNQSLPGVLSIMSLTGQVTHTKSALNETTTTYFVHVSARDNNGMAPYNAASNPATVMVFYLTSNNALTLAIGVPLSFVTTNRQQLENLLRNVTGQMVILKSLQKSPSDSLQTIAIVHLINNNSMAVLTRDEANRIFSDKSEEIETRYPEWKIKVISSYSPRTAARRGAYFSFYIGAIMMFAVLIGIVGLIGLIVVCRYKYREKSFYAPESQDVMSMDGTETAWHSIDIPSIGAYIESCADSNPGTRQRDMLQDGTSHHHSTNEEVDGPVELSLKNTTPTPESVEEEQTMTSVLGSRGENDEPLAERYYHATIALEGQSSSQGNPGNKLNRSNENKPHPLEELEKRISEEKRDLTQNGCETSTGAFLNKAYEDSIDVDTTPSKQCSRGGNHESRDPPSITFLATRYPFTRMNSKTYLPYEGGATDDIIAPRTLAHSALNGRSPRKRSDSYSVADYQSKNGKILNSEPAKAVYFPGRSSLSIAGIYDVQKRREQQRKNKKKRSSHVRFDLADNQHPDELEWERQVYRNRNISDVLASSDDTWNDADEQLSFFTFGRAKNESKTDDSPDLSVSNENDCEVWNLDDEHCDDGLHPPSDDENRTTYIINPEIKEKEEESYVITHL